MDPATLSDEVLDLIGAISMDRQDGAAAGNESRRKLHESHERGAQRAVTRAARP